MYFPSVRKQIRKECGHMDDGLYILSRVNKNKSCIIGISNGKLITKEFWNTRTKDAVMFLNDYIKTGVWDTGYYFMLTNGIPEVFRSNSEEEAKKWCKKYLGIIQSEVCYCNKFVQI